MDKIYNTFIQYLENEDKENAVAFILSKLESGSIDFISLYTDILTPALNYRICSIGEEKKTCIWKEHVRSSIVRTVIECCYPLVLREKQRQSIQNTEKKVLILCPSEEYHELGARMASDFFTFNGFETIFIGSNTPKEEFLSAIDVLKADYIVLSVTNDYHLVTAKKVIELIRKFSSRLVKIIVGGQAFKRNPTIHKAIGADIFIDSFEDIKALAKEEQPNETCI